jgi:PadR family transcriptional regulator, regulatory protein PadR
MSRRKPGAIFPLELQILEAGMQLQSAVGNFYGFALARSLASDDGSGLTAHGTLYKALTRMTDANLLEATWEDASIAETEGRPRRRLYTVTAEGQRVAAEARTQTAAVAELRPKSGMAFA